VLEKGHIAPRAGLRGVHGGIEIPLFVATHASHEERERVIAVSVAAVQVVAAGRGAGHRRAAAVAPEPRYLRNR
jgi:hypothetical protein